MTCHTPLTAAVLADYWLAALPPSEEDAAEEHLLSCDQCGDRLREIIALAQGIRNLAREGSLFMVVSENFLKRAREYGLHVREYAPPQSGSVKCTVTAEDDLLIGRLAADLTGSGRVDLRLYDAHGVEQLRLPDIPFNAEADAVHFQYSITHAKAAPSETVIARLIALDDAGRETLLGEYTFNHERSLPGPAAW